MTPKNVLCLGLFFRKFLNHIDAPRIAFLEVADQFLLLGVDGDDGLVLGLRRNDFRIDVFELGVSVGMFRAFIRLAVGLARELIGCPIWVRVAASFSMLFDTQINGRMGSPSVAGSSCGTRVLR
jgi:hypothetical protein